MSAYKPYELLYIKAGDGKWDVLRLGEPVLARCETEEAARGLCTFAALLAALKAVEWSGLTDDPDGGYVACCPYCEGPYSERVHLPNCPVGRAIAQAEGGES